MDKCESGLSSLLDIVTHSDVPLQVKRIFFYTILHVLLERLDLSNSYDKLSASKENDIVSNLSPKKIKSNNLLEPQANKSRSKSGGSKSLINSSLVACTCKPDNEKHLKIVRSICMKLLKENSKFPLKIPEKIFNELNKLSSCTMIACTEIWDKLLAIELNMNNVKEDLKYISLQPARTRTILRKSVSKNYKMQKFIRGTKLIKKKNGIGSVEELHRTEEVELSPTFSDLLLKSTIQSDLPKVETFDPYDPNSSLIKDIYDNQPECCRIKKAHNRLKGGCDSYSTNGFESSKPCKQGVHFKKPIETITKNGPSKNTFYKDRKLNFNGKHEHKNQSDISSIKQIPTKFNKNKPTQGCKIVSKNLTINVLRPDSDSQSESGLVNDKNRGKVIKPIRLKKPLPEEFDITDYVPKEKKKHLIFSSSSSSTLSNSEVNGPCIAILKDFPNNRKKNKTRKKRPIEDIICAINNPYYDPPTEVCPIECDFDIPCCAHPQPPPIDMSIFENNPTKIIEYKEGSISMNDNKEKETFKISFEKDNEEVHLVLSKTSVPESGLKKPQRVFNGQYASILCILAALEARITFLENADPITRCLSIRGNGKISEKQRKLHWPPSFKKEAEAPRFREWLSQNKYDCWYHFFYDNLPNCKYWEKNAWKWTMWCKCPPKCGAVPLIDFGRPNTCAGAKCVIAPTKQHAINSKTIPTKCIDAPNRPKCDCNIEHSSKQMMKPSCCTEKKYYAPICYS